ncbi:uncharacterized protein LOC131846215 [Achroia grisella]|uniref:uncharacterized protein LOC131846215 n=1 Tax=Achroia grisella TaxID=688607 RepID=UPI0027D2FFD4|nr:uncharacterized protein LOC131846215 [Achroia grisella]
MFIKCVLFVTLFTVVYSDYDNYDSGSQCTFPHFDHGRINTRRKYRLYRFMCYHGFMLVGNRYATCRNGEWDVPWPVCVKPGCIVPNVPHSLQLSKHDNAWLTFFCLPGYELKGRPAMYCDGITWNGTAPSCVDTNTASKLSCDFEKSDLCGWMNDDLHDFDWKRLNLATPSALMATGPSYDHTLGEGASGYYMYIESTARSLNDTARLISPVYSKELTKGGCFSFYYHMFGKDIGGLRVYQKPDNYPLAILTVLHDKQKFLLFEKWGNQGDTWYGSISPLKDQGDDFQIIIEGIRGKSFTSDIAIDDVAIMQGEDCNKAVPTPPTFLSESCEGRCNVYGNSEPKHGCGCTAACVLNSMCCADFFEMCVFSSNMDTTPVDDDKASSIEPPQTQKLVSKSSDAPTTVPSKTTKTLKTTVVTTTVPPKTTKSKTTTVKTTPKITPKTSRTTKILTTTKTTTVKPITTSKKVTSKSKPTTSTKMITTKKSTTTIKPTTTVTATTNKQIIDSASRRVKDKQSNEWSGLKTWTVVLAVLLCCFGAGWLMYASRGAHLAVMLARVRGRTQNDPEVRYLHSNADDD